jgi:hypothetical protein
MTTRPTPASFIIGTTRSIVNGSGNCGFAPASQGRSGVVRRPEVNLRVDDYPARRRHRGCNALGRQRDAACG